MVERDDHLPSPGSVPAAVGDGESTGLRDDEGYDDISACWLPQNTCIHTVEPQSDTFRGLIADQHQVRRIIILSYFLTD